MEKFFIPVNISLLAPFNGVFSGVFNLTGSVLLADLSVCALGIGYIYILYLCGVWIWKLFHKWGTPKTKTQY